VAVPVALTHCVCIRMHGALHMCPPGVRSLACRREMEVLTSNDRSMTRDRAGWRQGWFRGPMAHAPFPLMISTCVTGDEGRETAEKFVC
jgi:hypothetical protein